ncbi:MAG: hypothetical protein MZV63_37475 [Marinilabiliales bacterium]|nr:hypothetical protein [Marinilabiliales bacterium]
MPRFISSSSFTSIMPMSWNMEDMPRSRACCLLRPSSRLKTMDSSATLTEWKHRYSSSLFNVVMPEEVAAVAGADVHQILDEAAAPCDLRAPGRAGPAGRRA